ncbi:NUDIX hydrolase [Halovenus halobia]|uniref:NUDIX hydrolase n=1 Tax=Halovenus halobia TaxID=3396622 RepID=UPI003F579B43
MPSNPDSRVSAATAYRESAKALLTAGERVLLVAERHSDGTPFWTLPGGGVDADETPTEGLARELREELGCSVAVRSELPPLWYAHTGPEHDVSRWRVYRCQQQSTIDPDLRAGIVDARWVRPDELPPETLLHVRYLLDSVDYSL